MTTDARVVYGARCSWWDSIDKAGTSKSALHSIPCCPHCKQVLFEMESQEHWDAMVEKYENDGHPGYKAMVDWGRGKCFPNTRALEAAYNRSKAAVQ